VTSRALRRAVAPLEWQVERTQPYAPVHELRDGDRHSIDN
jgi:hypothetical protein